jgi:hypothetical protein
LTPAPRPGTTDSRSAWGLRPLLGLTLSLWSTCALAQSEPTPLTQAFSTIASMELCGAISQSDSLDIKEALTRNALGVKLFKMSEAEKAQAFDGEILGEIIASAPGFCKTLDPRLVAQVRATGR